MSYLLTNGITTDNLETYIKDILFLNFHMMPDDIPYNTQLGVDRRVSEVSLVEFTDSVRISINSFLTKLNNRHNLNMTIFNMDVTVNKIDLIINLGDESTIEYELPINN